MHVLLIEPDTVLAKTAEAYLAKSHTVILARDVQTAIHVFDTEQVDVVVTELSMPGHNGIEFLYELRSYEDLQHVPVVLYTSLKLDAAQQALLLDAMGVSVILDKVTTTLEQLSRAIASSKAALT